MPDVSLTRRSVINGVPLSLTVLRALLAPLIVTLALLDPDPRAFGVCLALGFLSDVFDGIVARKLGIATPASLRGNSCRCRRARNLLDAGRMEIGCTFIRPRIQIAGRGAFGRLISRRYDDEREPSDGPPSCRFK